MYSLKIEDGGSVADHLNAFNILVTQLGSVRDKIDEQDHYMLLLCSFSNSWDHLVMAIGSSTSTFKMDEVVASLLFEEMQKKSFEMAKEALAVCGRPKERGKKKDKQSKSKSSGRSKSPGKKSKAKCWNCGEVGHIRKDCKEKKKNKSFSNFEFEKSSQDDGEAFIATLAAHASDDVWFIDSGASFHMTSHRDWFLKYEKYNGGEVYLGDDSHLKIVGRGRVNLIS